MKGLRGFLKSMRPFLADESGQATTEYILILSVTVVGASALARTVLRALDNGVLKMGAELEKNLKTGRAPVNVWSN